MKLFAFGFDFNPIYWIIGSEAKIWVASRDIFPLFYFFSQFHKIPTTNPKSPSVSHQSLNPMLRPGDEDIRRLQGAAVKSVFVGHHFT